MAASAKSKVGGVDFAGSGQTLRAERLVMIDVPSTPERLTPAAGPS